MIILPNIDPIALNLGPIQVHWYGIMYIVGLLCGYFILRWLIKQQKTSITMDHAEDAIIFTALGLMLGGRLGYFLFYQPDVLFQQPLQIFKLANGGMSFHGALLGIIIAAIIFSKRYQVRLGEIVNILALTAPIGIFFGRLGNFINQELWGRASDMPWAMVFARDPLGLARHPSQLYEALGEGLFIFLVILWFNKKPRPDWAAGALFIALYGSVRFVLEFFREPDSFIGFDAFGWMSRGQILCLPMAIIGCAIFIWAMKRKNPPMIGKALL